MLIRVLKFCVVLSLTWSFMAHAVDENTAIKWFERDSQDNPQVLLHFFWSKKCPHCLHSLPYLEVLDNEYTWLTVKSYQLVGNDRHIKQYQLMAEALGEEARSVPAFLFCNSMLTGFDERATPDLLKSKLNECHEYLKVHTDLDG